jgi:hypothetical protein
MNVRAPRYARTPMPEHPASAAAATPGLLTSPLQQRKQEQQQKQQQQQAAARGPDRRQCATTGCGLLVGTRGTKSNGERAPSAFCEGEGELAAGIDEATKQATHIMPSLPLLPPPL